MHTKKHNTTESENDDDVNFVELFDIPDSDELSKTKKRHPLDPDDQRYIVKCIEKYGTDGMEKSFRDIKLNYMQYSKAQLQKMVARFMLLEEDERVVELPSNISGITTESS